MLGILGYLKCTNKHIIIMSVWKKNTNEVSLIGQLFLLDSTETK